MSTFTNWGSKRPSDLPKVMTELGRAAGIQVFHYALNDIASQVKICKAQEIIRRGLC